MRKALLSKTIDGTFSLILCWLFVFLPVAQEQLKRGQQ